MVTYSSLAGQQPLWLSTAKQVVCCMHCLRYTTIYSEYAHPQLCADTRPKQGLDTSYSKCWRLTHRFVGHYTCMTHATLSFVPVCKTVKPRMWMHACCLHLVSAFVMCLPPDCTWGFVLCTVDPWGKMRFFGSKLEHPVLFFSLLLG